MEILYTEITQDLTAELLKVAVKELKKGRKIYYLVPSSMSFEKEKKILERLGEGTDIAVFDLLVTRFKQLPYYFDKQEKIEGKVELSQAGFSMLFRHVMSKFSKEELPLYFSLKNSSGFLEMLVNFRSELLTANLSVEDLPDSPKNRELKKIFLKFEEELSTNYANYSEFDEFTARVNNGEFDEILKNTVIIIDGYTRFSAQEENFIDIVNQHVSKTVIGTYADQYQLTDFSNTVYVDSVQMMGRFHQKFDAKIKKINCNSVNEVYSKLTKIVENEEKFVISNGEIEITEQDKHKFEIWEAENQTVEIERIAKKIRKQISKGALFKDFTVLVGDLSAYEISVKEIFDLYEIPFFYAKEESMSQHPLIVFFESLYAVKKKNYRTDDVVNLLKSKVYRVEKFSQEKIDQFEYYIQKFKISGRKRFTENFEEEAFTHLQEVEQLRLELLGEQSALQKFLTNNGQKTGKQWIIELQEFMKNGHVLLSMNELYSNAEAEGNHEQADKHEQVWKSLLSTLTELSVIFSEEKLKLLEFLDILLAGLKNAKYRQIPANVDVVNVKDYELVEPRTNKYIYAIGLSQTNFPRLKKNSTLLSDEERAEVNRITPENKFLEQLTVANYHKNLLTTLSLINSATECLVISAPQILGNEQGEFSPIFQLILSHSSEKILQKIRGVNLDETVEQIGNYRSVIAMMGKIERELLEKDIKSEDKRAFWSSLFRILLKTHVDFKNLVQKLEHDIDAVNLESDTVNQIYGDKIYASVSSFERFYNCEYQYFLENTLGLETFETIDINSKIVGNFFHEVFEKLMSLTELSVENFDEKLSMILNEVDSNYSKYFKQDARSRFTRSNLEEITRQTATLLKKSMNNNQLRTLMTESSFGLPKSELGHFSVNDIYLRGRIDRIDQLGENIGAVDYKSSAHTFKIQDVYDGLSLQFLTYLDVLQKAYPAKKMWGALYLQFKNQAVNLSDVNQLSEVSQLMNQNMRYEGLLLSETIDELKNIDYINIKKNNIYTPYEFEKLLIMNEKHYQTAGQRLKEGKIAINPVMRRSEGIDKSGNVQGCRYCPLKSICRFEANIHMGRHTREIGQKTSAEIMEELKEGEK